ncbi:GDSL-type esterase/lipase family protein [Streptomyces xiaopingdaonensis]|uniref:GDSL-type esterase/lipase family protein n=1 Tax=Streptomyces xiaopingdaonensis TaxID=1565415 RepID=UPI000314F323|nr:GDSL-type esterase/lipase family protein [Streptomyces xiaopingdaonensis]
MAAQRELARTGARAAHVRREQLATAVALAPAVATCVVGVNDVLDRRFDVARFAVEYEALVGGLREAAHVGVLAMTLHDLSEGLPLTRRARTSLRSRTAAANKVIEEVAAAHGAWLLEAREAVAFRGAGMLSVDRLHPNRRGHRYLAACAAEVLRGEGRVRHTVGPPAADPLGRRLRATGGHLRWLARHLAGGPR